MSSKRLLYIVVLIAILAAAGISAVSYVRHERLGQTLNTVANSSVEDHGDVLQRLNPRIFYSDQDHGDILLEVMP